MASQRYSVGIVSELQLIAATAFGLESVVRRELEQLEYQSRIISPGKVLFDADWKAVCRTNLWLRSADRIGIRVTSFRATDFEVLFETIRAIDWCEWLPADGCFPVTGRSLKSQLSSVPAVQRSAKKAIVSSLQTATKTVTLPETGPKFPIDVAILNDEVTLTIDTTGPSLHKRGYRPRNGPAPLKETLAAALVQLSFWNQQRPLVDPFCGTGTIPIEAAMIGRNLAPGIHRSFLCEQWPQVPAKCWVEAREEARGLANPDVQVRLIGQDIDQRALQMARQNATRAGVESDIHFQQKPFQELTSKREYGCVITNPPYGQRIGQDRELRTLYETIPEVLSRLPTWSHFVLTAYPDFERLVQRSADRRRKLYNGRIQCTFYQFHGPKPVGQADAAAKHDFAASQNATEPAGRDAVFGGLDPKAQEQAQIFRNRLTKLVRHLRRWPTRREIFCYRLYDRDIPEIPLIIERFEDYLHVTEYERPHQRDRGQHARWLELMLSTAGQVLEIPRAKIFLKRRQRQRGTEQHEKIGQKQHEVVVREGGLRFTVNLSDYVDTGLFLDHRLTRDMVRQEAAGTRFLNLFAYTGSFTVYAADGGAASTTSVDWSSTYQERARQNMRLNNFTGQRHQFVRMDVQSYTQNLPQTELFDLAVVDPPTYSNSKRTDRDWDIQRDYAPLLNELLQRITQGGIVYFATNFRRFKFDAEQINASSIHEISHRTIPADFRNRRIHRCWKFVR